MLDNIIVAFVLILVGFVALRGVIKMFRGEGGCKGSCTCPGFKPKSDCCGGKEERPTMVSLRTEGD